MATAINYHTENYEIFKAQHFHEWRNLHKGELHKVHNELHKTYHITLILVPVDHQR